MYEWIENERNLYPGREGERGLLYRFVESCKSNVNGSPLSDIKSLKQRRITIKIKVRVNVKGVRAHRDPHPHIGFYGPYTGEPVCKHEHLKSFE